MTKPRLLCWFSCGAASAVATKKSIQLHSNRFDVIPVNCDTRSSDHPDNYRFAADCERWFEKPIVYIESGFYKNVDEVFEHTRYMSGVQGARCTTELKKVPRLAYAQPHDTHVFGFTADELKRARDFRMRNPELKLKWILFELLITKQDCLDILQQAGIALPAMYFLGFNNNNCPGCVKASSPWYWSMVRKHFPEVFAKRCEQSRKLGVRLVEIRHHQRIFLDELPDREFKAPRRKENLSCGPECGVSTLNS